MKILPLILFPFIAGFSIARYVIEGNVWCAVLGFAALICWFAVILWRIANWN